MYNVQHIHHYCIIVLHIDILCYCFLFNKNKNIAPNNILFVYFDEFMAMAKFSYLKKL